MSCLEYNNSDYKEKLESELTIKDYKLKLKYVEDEIRRISKEYSEIIVKIYELEKTETN